MKRAFSKPPLAVLFVLSLLLLLSTSLAAAQEGMTEEPGTTTVVTSEPFEVTFGAGPFILLSPAQGLSDLSSYRATLIVSFDGTNTGQPMDWTRNYTLLATQDPSARQLTTDASDDPDGKVTKAELNNTLYEWREGSACGAPVIAADATAAEPWDPASFLNGVIGADEAGMETINGVDTNYYTFDESAQGLSGIADAAGELWVASQGGYLVRYRLTATGGAAYFGDNIEGTMTWDYEITDVNQPLTIEVPEDCPPPLLDIPVMPDAADVFQMPGSISFTTASSTQEAVAFYEEQVAALGGQPANPPLTAESSAPFFGTSATALYGFTLGDQSIMLIASGDGSVTNVQIQQLPGAAALSFTAEIPPLVIAPEDTLGHCAAGGVPTLDDASEVISMSGGLNYMTSASAAEAAAFYQEQFAALGAEVSTPTTIADITRFDVTQGFHTITVTLMIEGARTRVSLTSSTGSPVTPTTSCTGADSSECEAGGTPVLAGATNIQNVMGMISYNTDLSIAEVVAFYEEQIAAWGGQLSSTMPASDLMAILEVRLGDQSMMVMIGASGNATNVNITSLTGGPVPPPTMCMGSAGPMPAPTEVSEAEPQNTHNQCTAGTDSLPIPADATNIQAGAGLLSYTTQMSVADITTFYEEQVAALGGQVSTTMPATDMMASFAVTQGSQSVSVIIVSGGGMNNVSVTSMNPGTPLRYCLASVPAVSEPASDPTSDDCITSAEDIPILPDAANVFNTSGTITYVTATSMADAVAFYEEQLSLLGEITSPIPASDVMTMMNTAIGDYAISVSITALDQRMNSVSVAFMATNPFAGPPDCAAQP